MCVEFLAAMKPQRHACRKWHYLDTVDNAYGKAIGSFRVSGSSAVVGHCCG